MFDGDFVDGEDVVFVLRRGTALGVDRLHGWCGCETRLLMPYYVNFELRSNIDLIIEFFSLFFDYLRELLIQWMRYQMQEF